jgi:hypothetical protein
LGAFKNYLALNDRICSKCNGHCKILDEQLCRSSGEAFFRSHLGITGRRGHEKVNPFYRGSAGGGRLEMQGVNAATGKGTALGIEDGGVRELCEAIFTTEDGCEHVLPLQAGMTPDQFREAYRRLGMTKVKQGFVNAYSSEVAWAESLLRTVFEDVHMVSGDDQPDSVTYKNVVITFTVTERYFRALAKIGFHYFLTKMPRFTGAEYIFAEIRNFVMTEGDLKRCERFVSYTHRQMEIDLARGRRTKYWGHLLTAESEYRTLLSRVQLFIGPEYLPPVYTIRLAPNPSRIHFNEACGSWFQYYEPEYRGDFDGEVSDVWSIPAS